MRLWLFFFEEIKRIDEWHTSKLEKTSYTANQTEAGYQNLSEKWGFVLVLKELAGFNPQIERMYLDMMVYEFYTTIQIKNNISFVADEYNKLVKQTNVI